MREAEHFLRYQCLICGKVFDSEEAHEEHERKCKKGFGSVPLRLESEFPEVPKAGWREAARYSRLSAFGEAALRGKGLYAHRS